MAVKSIWTRLFKTGAAELEEELDELELEDELALEELELEEAELDPEADELLLVEEGLVSEAVELGREVSEVVEDSEDEAEAELSEETELVSLDGVMPGIDIGRGWQEDRPGSDKAKVSSNSFQCFLIGNIIVISVP